MRTSCSHLSLMLNLFTFGSMLVNRNVLNFIRSLHTKLKHQQGFVAIDHIKAGPLKLTANTADPTAVYALLLFIYR